MQIKLLTCDEIIRYHSSVVNLLGENIAANLPGIVDPVGVAEKEYVDLIEYSKNGSLILFGAVVDNDLIAVLWAYRREFLNETRIHLRDIIVRDIYRGAGIGSKMEEQLVSLMKDEGIKKIELMVTIDNNRAVNFYEKLGYCGTRMLMEKSIDL